MLLLAAGLAMAAPPAVAVQPRAPTLDWTTAPVTPGAWVYRASASNARSRAIFGRPNAPLFEIACTNQGGIALFRHGASAGVVTIRASTTMRQLAGNAVGGGLSIALPATDAILDAMAFSRGRFAVEAPRAATIIVPAWPELARVVEDCRRA